jgi:hypothetical protein
MSADCSIPSSFHPLVSRRRAMCVTVTGSPWIAVSMVMGADRPAHTRSVVHQIAPVADAHDRGRPRGAAGLWPGWRTALAVIASLLPRSRSFPSPEEVATAPFRRCPTLKERSLTGSGPSPPSRVDHSARHACVSTNREASRHRCLLAGSYDPAVSRARHTGHRRGAKWRADGRRSESATSGKQPGTRFASRSR